MSKQNNNNERRVQIALLWWLRATIIMGIAWGLLAGEWEVFFISIVALVLTFIPELIKNKYKILLPIEFDIVLVVFVFAAVFLGEVGDAYERFWWWDALLHMTSGIILAFAGFLILYIMISKRKIDTSPFIIALFAFCFGLALGAVWEIFEFVVDQNFGTNMQKNGLHDTMWDLIVDAVGALFVAWFGYQILAEDNKKGIIGESIERFFDANPHLKRRRMIKK